MARKIKVRAALVVDEHGRFGVAGWTPNREAASEQMMDEAYAVVEPEGLWSAHWITVEVDAPSATEVAADVEAHDG